MKILGFVPAKSNSSRLKDKNMLPINGKPLFINAAENLAKVIPRENIYIDTNDDKYISLAQNNGFNFIKRSMAYMVFSSPYPFPHFSHEQY